MKNLLLILISLISMEGFGTAQEPDYIIIQGEKYELFSNPVEIYFDQHPEKRPEIELMMTSLWRGYVATFEVRNQHLYLIDMEIPYYEEDDDNYDLMWKSILNEVFPDSKEVLVNWLKGILVIPQGEMLQYVHMGYASIFSNYMLISVNEGEITGIREMDYEGYELFKEKQFQAFKKTEEYATTVEEMKSYDPNIDDEFLDGFLRQYIIDYTSVFLDE